MEWELQGVDGHCKRIGTLRDKAPSLAIEPASEPLDGVWAPPSFSLAEEKWGDLEVSGVMLPPAEAVGLLIVNT